MQNPRDLEEALHNLEHQAQKEVEEMNRIQAELKQKEEEKSRLEREIQEMQKETEAARRTVQNDKSAIPRLEQELKKMHNEQLARHMELERIRRNYNDALHKANVPKVKPIELRR